ncbi:MAG: hypothetical protein HY644_04425 [Acidobacteria bacterium]|nr:hypothetical protein [Acidobacteriota bacterium]
MQIQAPLEKPDEIPTSAERSEKVKAAVTAKVDKAPLCLYQRPNCSGQDCYTEGSLIVRQDSEGFEVKDTGDGRTYRVQRIKERWIGPCNCGLDTVPPPSYQCPHQIAARGLVFNRWWFGKPYPVPATVAGMQVDLKLEEKTPARKGRSCAGVGCEVRACLGDFSLGGWLTGSLFLWKPGSGAT